MGYDGGCVPRTAPCKADALRLSSARGRRMTIATAHMMGTGWSHVCSIQLDIFLEHRPTRCMDAHGCLSRGSIDMFNVTNPIITNRRLGSRRAELTGFAAETVVTRECRG